MKKGLRKLILSGAALSAVAATLGTSTYAWYTTNTTVEANNIIGASADGGAASIYISNDGSHWYSKLDGNSTGYDDITITGSELQPVTLASGVWKDAKGQTVASPSVLTFTLYFKTAKLEDTTQNVNLGIDAITIANTTGSVKETENLIDGTTYSVDFLNALAMRIESATSTTANISNAGFSLTPGQGCVTRVNGNSYAASPITGTYASAHDYVKAVTQDNNAVTQTDTTTDELESETNLAVLPGTGAAQTVTFTIFLDGADVDCFDACRGQQFTLNMKFKIIA